jgi:nicotinate phosphoribosyltransferase
MITSILEQDMYKLTMGQVVHFLFPSVSVEYGFINRGKTPFPVGFDKALRNEIKKLTELKTTKEEVEYLKTQTFLTPVYIDFLKNFQYDDSQVIINQKGGELSIKVKGLWQTSIFWEVTLMATISELYFKMTGQEAKSRPIREGVNKQKAKALRGVGAKFADFGLRRRYSSDNHREVLEDLISEGGENLVGTSTVKYAMDYGITPIGTMAHEFIMAESALRGLRYANRYAMEDWNRIYRGDLGIVLTDTFGMDAFLNDFDKGFAKTFDGVRHDSGDPRLFADRMITHYNSLGINPLHKNIVFSDGLNVEIAKELVRYCTGKIQCSFGIGTNFTNDVGVKALNMVIKLRTVNGIQVVKLGDGVGKETGDAKAVDVAKWTFGLGEY